MTNTQKNEKLYSMYRYVKQYLEAVDEEREDNQKILLEVIRKFTKDLDEMYGK